MAGDTNRQRDRPFTSCLVLLFSYAGTPIYTQPFSNIALAYRGHARLKHNIGHVVGSAPRFYRRLGTTSA